MTIFFFLSNRNISIGAPIKAVMAPTGNMIGLMRSFAIMSAMSSSRAPNAAEAGIRNFKLPPIIILETWGAKRHMNPIAPVKQMATDVEKHASNTAKRRVLFTSIPSEVAVSSPILNSSRL